jgi:hypothetical protein
MFNKSPSHCLMASAALGQSERVAELRSYLAQGFATSAGILADRFEKEIRAKRLSARIPGRVRVSALIDLMQGMLLRAKAGVSREALLKDTLSYVPLILD